MDETEIARLEETAKRLQDGIDKIRAKWDRLNLPQRQAIYNFKEQLHAIYAKLIHPGNLVLHKIAVDTFHLGRGSNLKLITETLKQRGYLFAIDFEKQQIRFRRQINPTLDRPPREFDVVEVTGGKSPTVQPTETKTPKEIIDSVKGGTKKGPMDAEFKLKKGSRKALGGQLATEDWIKDLATRAEVEHVGMTGTNIVDGTTHHVKVTPDNLKKSFVSTYQVPGKTLFESSRAAAPRGGAPPIPTAAQPPASPRGKRNTGIASKGTAPPAKDGKPSPWQRGARKDTATKQAKALAPSPGSEASVASKLNDKVQLGVESGKPKPAVKAQVVDVATARPTESGRAATAAQEAIGNRMVDDLAEPPRVELPHNEPHIPGKIPHSLPRASSIKGVSAVGKILAVGRVGIRASRWVAGALIAMYLVPPLKMWEWAIEIGFHVLDDLLAYRRTRQRNDRRKEQALHSVFEGRGNALGTLIVASVTTDQQYNQLLDGWNTNPRLPGFMYSRISAVIEEEIFRGGPRNLEIEKLTRYRPVQIDVRPTSAHHEFTLERIGEELEAPFKKADKEYVDAAVLKSDFEDGVLYTRRDAKWLQRYRLMYTIQTPAITPFDIALIKANNLFMDLLAFVSSFAAARPVLELVGSDYQETYQERIGMTLEFPAPLNASVCDYCLSYLNWTARQLSEHQIREVDLHGGLEAPRRGWERRRDILYRLLVGRGSTKYGKNFEYFVSQMGRIASGKLRDLEAVAVATELEACAWALLADLRRLDRSQTAPEYYYFGPSFRYQKK